MREELGEEGKERQGGTKTKEGSGKERERTGER